MRIKEIRLQNGISQKQLALAIGVAQNTLSQYENGKRAPDFDTMARISDYFHVSVDYLLGRDEEKPFTNTDEGQMEALDAEIIGRLVSLTPEEIGKVDAFVQGMIASRSKGASPPM